MRLALYFLHYNVFIVAIMLTGCAGDPDSPVLHLPPAKIVDLALNQNRVVHRPLVQIEPPEVTVIPVGDASSTSPGAPGGNQSPVALLPAPISLSPTAMSPASPQGVPELSAWQLRSAMPGRAWVIQPGQEALGPVEVREEGHHPVLGHILSITRDGDRWTVHAEQGSLSGGPL